RMSIGQQRRAVEFVVAGGWCDRAEIIGRGLVIPVHLFVDIIFFVEQTAERAQAPIVRRADPDLVALMRVLFDVVPGRTRREALRLAGERSTRTDALIIVGILAARVVRIVLHLIDVAD